MMEHRVENVSQFKGETMRVDFDDAEPVFIHCSVVQELGMRPGIILTEEEISEAIRRNNRRRAREWALYLLDERDYGYVEMFKKLNRNYPEDICYEVVNSLAEQGLIDDRKYAARCAEYYIVTKNRGKYRAKEEMRRRGIPSELIDEALEDYDEGTYSRLRELVEKKYLRKLTEEDGARKVKASLARQGFGFDEINAVLREFDKD